MFAAGVLCLIPGEIPKGPLPLDYARQVVGRFLDHHASHGAWAICAILVAYHVRQVRKEDEAASKRASAPAISQG